MEHIKMEHTTLLNQLAKFITSSNKVNVFLKPIHTPCCNVKNGEITLNEDEKYPTNKAVLIHECGHFLFTEKISREIEKEISDLSLFMEISNVLEDQRTEHLISKIIPEAKRLLNNFEIGIIKKMGENIKITRETHGLFLSIKKEREHLKDILKIEISERIKSKVEKAFKIYQENEEGLLNGSFKNMVRIAKLIYNVFKEEEIKSKATEEGDEGKEDEKSEDKAGLGGSDGRDEGDGEERETSEERETVKSLKKGDLDINDFKGEVKKGKRSFGTSDGGTIEGRDLDGSDLIGTGTGILEQVKAKTTLKIKSVGGF